MKDKLLNLENGKAVCVIDELNYKEKKYILTVECDTVNEELLNKYRIYEVLSDNSSVSLNSIIDRNILESVTHIFLDNIKNI